MPAAEDITCGASVRVRMDDGTGNLVFIDGSRSDGATDSNDYVDTTNKDNSPWRYGLANCGIRSVTITIVGFVTSSTIQALLWMRALTGTIHTFELIDSMGFFTKGAFLVQSAERSGEYNGAEEISIVLASAAQIKTGISCIATESDDSLITEDGAFIMPESF